ncbi:IS701 family transposase [Sphaerothrix gracilis]|uniref:IS701 family transposase n=1 Tax=Sphaerothrix gracilis TaxID=3151835 RepID=UPI0031FDB756
MRILTKPSTAHCTLNLYVRYLLAQPQGSGCCELAEILKTVSHDSINRFLCRERYVPKDLFDELVAQGWIDLVGGVLSADDTVLEKPYAQRKATALLGYFWSSKAAKPVLGLSLVTLYYTSANGLQVPINYRLYDKAEGKTKNQYFQEMWQEVRQWGLCPRAVTSDTWYAAKANLNVLKDDQTGFLVGVAKNRLVRSTLQQAYQRVEALSIPESGILVYLRGVGRVKLFCQRFKNESCRYYALYWPDPEALEAAGADDFEQLHTLHWGIECFHRAGKQLCALKRFRVRLKEAIDTHIFCALRAFVELELQVWHQQLGNWYELQRHLYQDVARQFILQAPLMGRTA